MLPSLKHFRRLLRMAARLGATQISMCAGEGLGSIQEITSTVRYYGYANLAEYLRALCEAVLDFRGERVLFPVLDVGRLSYPELKRVAPVVASVRYLIDSADDSLLHKPAHAGAPVKNFEDRLAGLNELGRLRIPTITGIRVGIGEKDGSWIEAAEQINIVQRRYHNIQALMLVPFRPVPFSDMAINSPAPTELLREVIELIRPYVGSDIPIIADVPNEPLLHAQLLDKVDPDLGCVRLGSSETVYVDVPQGLETLKEHLRASGHIVRARMPWTDEFLENREVSNKIFRSIEAWNRKHREEIPELLPALDPKPDGEPNAEEESPSESDVPSVSDSVSPSRD